MKYPVYSYRDLKVGFGSPVIDNNDQSAIRGFSYAVNQQNGMMNFSPRDYELYRIGEFDTEKGMLIPLEIPVQVITGLNVFEVSE